MSKNIVRLALFEPDIPQNTGTLLRLAACLGVSVDVVEPCGFVWGGKHMRRSGMDYLEQVEVIHHLNWQTFSAAKTTTRRVLLTTKSAYPFTEFEFKNGDTLLLGSESSGVPDHIHNCVEARVTVPMREGLRSLNLATAAAMVLGEALRQLDAFPKGIK
jgi:tRNA (cytidine/uridine-2'-O-)-methyltransferase